MSEQQTVVFRRVRGRIVPIRTSSGKVQKKREVTATEIAVKGSFTGVVGAIYGSLIGDYMKHTLKPPVKPKPRAVNLATIKAGPGVYDLNKFRKEAEAVAKQNKRALTVFQRNRRAFIQMKYSTPRGGKWYTKRSLLVGAAIGAGIGVLSAKYGKRPNE